MPSNPNLLIGTRWPAPRQMEMALNSWQSWDYYNLGPYPTHAFGPKQWPRDKGPFPTALPYVRTLIDEGAEFVFRNGSPTFSIPGDQDLSKLLETLISRNNLKNLWIPLAVSCGNQGAIACKWSVDTENKLCPVRYTFLDIPQECRVWVDPHDRTQILMARIQYPYRDLDDGKWYFYREEWTEDYYVRYQPREAGKADISNPMLLSGYNTHLGDEGDWQVDYREDNKIGMIPIRIISNKPTKSNPLGEGDCWQAFRLTDRLALTMHGEDRSNQFHSEPLNVALNAQIQNEGPPSPGEILEVINENPEGPPADFKLLEPSGRARSFTHMDIDKWEELLWGMVGLSRVRTENVTNKGNMTALAFAITYARSVATSDRKRENWGNSGMALVFRDTLIGLNRMGVPLAQSVKEEEIEVAVEWPPYFEQTDEDKQTLTNRTVDQMNNALIPHEDAVKRVGQTEKVPQPKVEEWLKQLSAERQAIVALTASKLKGELPGPDHSEVANVRDTSGVNNFTA